ncbi:hypothetical protein [Dactylosporangium sp. NPDC051541]|uniref:hypothetical protein n=1 Tax=Dactylosporangium sp. NPDC051541 TaxID=3363977 RepID=UPI003787A183
MERNNQGLRNVAFVVSAVLAAVLLAAAWPTIRDRLPFGSSAAASSDDGPDTAPGGPFAGTPAESYAKGAAGITLPPAAAVDGFTAAQVDAALQQVRRALVAGRLDNRMTVSHDNTALLNLLAPNARKEVGAWFTDPRSFTSVATWIDPAVHLDPKEEARVSGKVTVGVVPVNDIPTLQVTTNFVWIYAFEKAGSPLAVVHDEVRWDFAKPDNLRPGDEGMWIGTAKSYLALIDCTAAAKGLLAPARPVTATADSGAGEDENSYLRPDRSLEISNRC